MARLYRTPVPERAVQTVDDTVRQELARAQHLGATEEIKQLGAGSADLTVDGEYSGQYADRLGPEFEELLSSATIEAIPVYNVGHGKQGYYTTDQVDESPTTPKSDPFATIFARLSKNGTHNTHWLAVTTRPSQPEPGHSFGNDTTGYIGIPVDAQRVRAVDATSQPTERDPDPTPDATIQAEHGAVDLHDATALAFSEPVYLYDLPYAAQGDVDPGVWDTHDESRTDADGVVAWQRVFDTAHEFAGDAVVENGILRLTISEPAGEDGTGTLTAERWDDANTTWSSVSLTATDWAPLDLDIISVGQTVVTAQLEFRAEAATTDASAGDLYALDVHLPRGYEDAQWWIPESESDPIPTDLESHLDPIADSSVVDPSPEQTLVDREEVRK